MHTSLTSNLPSQKKRIESFDLLKAIASFFVVSMHTSMWHMEYLNFIRDIGPPCFLAITGYLLYSDDREREIKKCLAWAKKAFMLALWCNLVYAVAWYNHLSEQLTDPYFWLYDIFFSGKKICYALWYLTALWQALLIIALLRRYAPKLIYLLPLLWIVIYLMRNSDSVLIPFDNKVPISRMSVLTSLPFLATGYYIHMYKNKLLKLVNVKIAFTLVFIAAFFENLLYIKLLDHFALYHILTYPLIVLTMLLCIKYKDFELPIINTIGKKRLAQHILFSRACYNICMARWF